eukprot:gnl/MRDRNA2_/MRDRNA2_261786_c0_seq1.p1 gnl/MRDRNA2_/MRDRNA2_261786_c0~~gnl/MRDRNA2_/MRDRNA2_261786_c0_seq1.p1  ORF type:complete len:226 (+),score=22.21 gnl/MRDRNA2_/MRDRNA2_261786_c0_seq1:49-678(+)
MGDAALGTRSRTPSWNDSMRLSGTLLTQEQEDSLQRDPEAERFERVRFSLRRMAGATLGSAVTTAGSAAFLTMCTLRIFVKLGTVVLAVTSLSIVFALVPLPATLMIAGPTDKNKRKFIERVARLRAHISNGVQQYDWHARRGSHVSLHLHGAYEEPEREGRPFNPDDADGWHTNEPASTSHYVLGFVKPMTKKAHNQQAEPTKLDVGG